MTRVSGVRLIILVVSALVALVLFASCLPAAHAAGTLWPPVGQLTTGVPLDVAVQGNHLYVAAWGGMTVIDISTPSDLEQVAACPLYPVSRGIAMSGSYAYVANDHGEMAVVNVADPVHPQQVGSCNNGVNAPYDVAVAGQYAYVADYDYGLRVVSISNPTAPVVVGSCATPDKANAIAVSGSYAYIAAATSGLRVINVASPAAPVEVGNLPASSSMRAVAVSGSYAYVADGQDLRVVSISNPANPVEVGRRSTPGTCYGIAISGYYAYVAAGGADVRIISIATPANPVEVGHVDLAGSCFSVAVAGNYAYAVGDEIAAIAITNPASPVVVDDLACLGSLYDLAVAGDYAYLPAHNAGLHIVSVDDPANPVLVGSCATLGPAIGVAVSGRYAYVADGQAGLVIVDVANPSAPVITSYGNALGYAWDVAVAGSYAYVTLSSGMLVVIDVSNPGSPFVVGSCATPSAAYGVAVSGHYAYVAAYAAGLRIIDVADPAHPTEVAYWNPGVYPYHVSVVGNYAYVADLGSGARIVDVSDPIHPVEVGSCLTDSGYGVAAVGQYVYVASRFAGFTIFDVSDMAHPVEIGSFDTPAEAYGVAVLNGYVYLAVNGWGLMVFREAGGAIAGQVSASGTGASIPGAAIEVRSGDALMSSATTDASGVYSASGLAPGSYAVTARLAGYVSQTRAAVVSEGQTTYVNFYLDRSGRITGQVCEKGTGAGVEGAIINAYLGGQLKGSAATGADGIYAMEALPDGQYVVTARKQGYVAQTKVNVAVAAGQVAYVNFNLQVSGKLKGQALDKVSGTPIVGATIAARTGGVVWATGVTTAPYGIYEIGTDLPAGTYSLLASKAGYVDQGKIGIVVNAGGTTYVNFSLGKICLSGQVRQMGTITALKGATVGAYLGSATTPSATATTDVNGIYQIGGLTTGAYTVIASKSGYVKQTKPGISVTAGGMTYVNFALAVSGKLMGQVWDKMTSAPIIGATVSARSGGVVQATGTTVGPYGIYQISSDLPAGTYTMLCTKSGYNDFGRLGIVVTAGATTYVNFPMSSSAQ